MGFVYVSNKKAVYKQLDKAFDSMVAYYFKAIRAVISIDRTWSGFEKNPFRDILNTGEFRDSQGKQKISQMHWSIYWTAAYSVFILYGGKTPQGTSFPGRRVDLVAAQEVDLANFYIKAFTSGGLLETKGVVLFSGQEF